MTLSISPSQKVQRHPHLTSSKNSPRVPHPIRSTLPTRTHILSRSTQARPLYIPPLWAHTAAASSPGIVNISVNVFFRSLPDSVYLAGRDVYGNRDLQPYEDGRRDVDKIVKRFKVKAQARRRKVRKLPKTGQQKIVQSTPRQFLQMEQAKKVATTQARRPRKLAFLGRLRKHISRDLQRSCWRGLRRYEVRRLGASVLSAYETGNLDTV